MTQSTKNLAERRCAACNRYTFWKYCGKIDCDAVFIFVGTEANADLVKGLLNLDDKGFIIAAYGGCRLYYLNPDLPLEKDKNPRLIADPEEVLEILRAAY